jgi:hypothetical protein
VRSGAAVEAYPWEQPKDVAPRTETIGDAASAVRDPGRLRPEHMLALQASAGNQAVAGLVRAQRPTIARETPVAVQQAGGGGPAPVVSSVDEDSFNPESVVHDLRRAIDQSDTKAAPRNVEPSTVGLPTIPQWDLVRNVDTDDVVRALENKTRRQIERIDQIYASQEGGRSLDTDLFGKGESGYPSDLKPDEIARIKALMRGTRPEPGPPTSAEGGPPQAPEGRLEADAIELHQLIEKDLDNEGRRERVMALHRRPVAEITAIDEIYTKQYGHAPLQDLVGQLNDLQRTRLLMLRTGSWRNADALAIEEKRIALDELAEKAKEDPFAAIEAKEKRKDLIAGIESIVDQNRREAEADPANAGKSQAQAVQERMSQLLGASSAEPGKNLGEALAKSMGPVDSGAITAMLNGSLVQSAAQRLVAMEQHETTSTEQIAALLREFRTQAEHDVMAKAYDPKVAAEDKQALLDPAKLQAAVDEQAKTYTRSFADTYDRIRGEHRSYLDILESADEENTAMLSALTSQGGKLTPYQELDHAVRADEPKEIVSVLRKQPDGKAVKALVAEWNDKHKDKNLESVLFGMYGPQVAEKDIPKRYTGALLSGRDAASALEALEKPEQLGGDSEVEWTVRHGQAEVGVTEENSGVMGSLREIGDLPETQVLMRESGARLKALQEEWNRDDPWGRPREQIMRDIRRVRATLTGDATAYEKENEAMVAQLRSAISFAVQVALALALPGVGAGFLATTALNIGAAVASNMLIYGDQYSLTMFRNDIIGGGLGALGGKLGEEVVGLAAKEVAGSAGKAAAEAAERAGLSTALAKEAGMAAAAAKEASLVTKVAKEGANMIGGTAGTSVGTGENGFTLEGMAQNLFFMGVGKLGSKTQITHGETPPPAGHAHAAEHAPATTAGEHAPTSAPTEHAAPVPTAEHTAPPAGEHAPAPQEPVESKAPGAASDEPTLVERQPPSGEEPTVVEHRTLGPDEPTFVDDIADRMPDETVMQPSDPRDGASAQEMYENSVADRQREAAIYRNTETGEYIVIQGDEGMVSVGGRQEPRKGGYAQRWKEILNGGSDVGRWELQAHSHPSGEGGFVDPVNMWPSGANADMGAMLAESKASGEPRSSRIDYVTPDGPNHTDFGFDPTHERPIWVDLPDGRGGRTTRRFKTMESYHDFMENTMGAPQGEIPEHMSGAAPTPPSPGGSDSVAPGAAVGGPPGERPDRPALPPDFEVPEDFNFTTEGPPVAIPARPGGEPAPVLEIGAGPIDTNLGLPVEPGQGNQAVHDPSLVDVTRTDINPREGVLQVDAQQPIPPEFWGQDAVLINNPRGYQVDIGNVGEAVRPGGRIVIQGRAAVERGMPGTNPDMTRVLRAVLRGELPPGYQVVEVVTVPEAPIGDPAVNPKPAEVMGGPFRRTDDTGPVSWPNTRIVIERVVTPEVLVAVPEPQAGG